MRRRTAAALGALACAGLGLWGADRWIAATPLPPLLAPTSAIVTDADGVPLRIFLADDDRWRLPVALERVDPGYLAQLIAYEDKRFRSHHGVDPLALLRAAKDSLLAGRIVSGGSTLTMQVARLLDGGGTGHWGGKWRQMRLALALERHLSKDEILEIYLTRAPFGGNLEGVRAASFSYFGKDAHRLAPEEAALLVALPQSPETRRPDRASQAARVARNAVLDRNAANGALDPDLLARALRAPVPEVRAAFPAHAWHEAARAVAEEPAAPVHRLTLKATPQLALEALLADAAERLPPHVTAAVIVMEAASGTVVARVSSARPGTDSRSGFIDMTRAIRSPGSALKPFVYALAFANGHAHPETTLQDRPLDFGGYAPQNFDGGFRGPVSAREALQLSLNVPAVALLDATGPRRLMSFLVRAGAEVHTPGGGAPGLTAALGGLGITLEDLTKLYGTLARAGQGPDRTRLLPQAAAWYVTDILRGAPAPKGRRSGEIAFKTGTSYGYRDAWALGYDGTHVIGIWLGRADAGAVPGLTGIESAAPLLFQAFDRISPVRAPFAPPPPDALTVAHAELPQPLRALRPAAGQQLAVDGSGFEFAYPPSGARIDMGAPGQAFVAKLRAGRPPFLWMVDGAVVATGARDRVLRLPTPEAGFVTVTVLDRTGATARTTVEVLRQP